MKDPTRIWTAQLIAPYALAAFSVVGILGGELSHSSLEVHYASITLAVAVGWLILICIVIWLRRGETLFRVNRAHRGDEAVGKRPLGK